MNKNIKSTCYPYFPGATGPTGPTGMQGEIGATGPTGPQGENFKSIYGHKYSDESDTINLTANIPSQINLAIANLASDITITLENSMIINTYGIYRIDYFFSGSINEDAALTVEVNTNGAPINGAGISKDAISNTDLDFNGSTVEILNPRDIIDLTIKSSKNAVLTPAPDLNGYLIITKIN